jgi:hypothetical protein
MRSTAEILFRLRQEAANILYWLRPPRWTGGPPQALALPCLPPVERDLPLPLPPVPWRRDSVSGRETGLSYFRRIPYLDAARAGDHKNIWDRNRHQELAVLASRGEHETLCNLLADWINANPVHRGINWTSALEVAFRAISWLYVWKYSAAAVPPGFLSMLYAHGAHLHQNLSTYFSPNTHLLGEAVALHALGLFFNRRDWKRRGRAATLDCLREQVFPDGAYFEQSTYYHIYALDFFLLHHHLEPLPRECFSVLERMGLFLRALLGEAGEIPFLGDDDGGRLYHPFAEHSRFGCDTLARLWPAGAPRLEDTPMLFPDAGLVFLANGPVQILFDAGPFARGSAGHSHADALSVVARRAEREILIDPGTFTYVGDTALRELFRSSAMHNTARIDGLEQAMPAGPFRWSQPGVSRLLSSKEGEATAEFEANGFTHRRRLSWDAARQHLTVEDSFEGPQGPRKLEIFWHFASPEAARRLHPSAHPGFSLRLRPELSFRSCKFGEKHEAPALCFAGQARLPLTLRTSIDLTADDKLRR